MFAHKAGAAAASTCRRSCAPPSASRSASSCRRSRIRRSCQQGRRAGQPRRSRRRWRSATSSSATRPSDAGATRSRRAAPRVRRTAAARGQRGVRVEPRRRLRALVAQRPAAASTAARRTTSAHITCEVGVLPRAHGSALFTRGETQALVTATLGTSRTTQRIDTLHRRHRQALHAALQLPAVLDRRGQADARRQPPRDRPRSPGRARARAQSCPTKEDFPYTIRDRLRDPRVERQLVDGVGVRRLAVADGRGRADQGAGRRHRDGPDEGRRSRRRPLRHPRRRGSPRRHGLQGLRHASRASPRSRWTSRSRG